MAARRSAFKEADLWYRSAIEAWNHLRKAAQSRSWVRPEIDLYTRLDLRRLTPVFEVLKVPRAWPRPSLTTIDSRAWPDALLKPAGGSPTTPGRSSSRSVRFLSARKAVRS